LQKIHDVYKDLSANNVFHGILLLAQKDREEPERKYAALRGKNGPPDEDGD